MKYNKQAIEERIDQRLRGGHERLVHRPDIGKSEK